MAVLATKLHAPEPRRQLIPRTRLTERLSIEESSLPRLVLVSAPPGFGKTTLLGQWLAEEPGHLARAAWLSLDENDNDPRRFLSHVVAALHGADARVGLEADALLTSAAALPTEAVLTSLVNDLDQQTGQTVLALDDYHLIACEELLQVDQGLCCGHLGDLVDVKPLHGLGEIRGRRRNSIR
ncbi:MAG: hypothetical protein ACRDO2_14810 [Nocardioidaceae bacterium]